jgi:hypothetical protein
MGYTVGSGSDRIDDIDIDDDLLVAISRDLDGKSPWLDVRQPVPTLHVLRAAEVTGSSVEDVAARLTGLGFQIPADQFAHLTERIIGQVDAEDSLMLSEDLDGERPWLDVSQPVPMMHLLKAAKALDREVADVAARLIVLGYTVRTGEAGLDIDQATREHLLLVASSDLDGEDEFLDPDEVVPLGHVLKAARRVGRSAEQVTQWLRRMGYTVDDPPEIPPDGIRSADITLLSKDLDGEGPWLDPDRIVPLGHLFAAARTLRRPIADVRARLDQYGFRTADPAACLPRLRPGGAWHALLEVATSELSDLPGRVSQLSESAGRGDHMWTGRRLRDAVITGLLSTRRPDPQAVAALRRLATSYDQLPQHVADSDEVEALIFGGAKHHHLAWFAEGVDRLGRLEHLDPPPRDGLEYGTPTDVAAMVADLGGRPTEVLLRLAADLPKLGLAGAPLERLLAELMTVSLVEDRRDLATGLLPLVPEPVTSDLLAFTLACLHARYGDRHGAIGHIRLALELGRSAEQFRSDDRFAALRHDPEFLALLDEHP